VRAALYNLAQREKTLDAPLPYPTLPYPTLPNPTLHSLSLLLLFPPLLAADLTGKIVGVNDDDIFPLCIA